MGARARRALGVAHGADRLETVLGGFALAFMVSLVGIISSMFRQQKLHGEARWAISARCARQS
jgi:hypothetical protein